MNKCDFCTRSNSNGKCFWPNQTSREADCEKAINRMVKAFENKVETRNKS